MRLGRKKLIEQTIVPLLFAAYLLLSIRYASHWNTILLGFAIILGARQWEIWGGLFTSALAGVALFGSLWLEGAFLTDTRMLQGYLWAWLSTFILAFYVGGATRQAKRLEQMNAELRQAQEYLTALHKISTALTSTLDVDHMLAQILEHLEKLWGYDYGAIVLLDEEQGDMVVAEAQGYAQGKGQRMPAEEGICWAVLRSGRPLCIGDVTQDARYVRGIPNARSELAVPLICQGKPLGVLNVESTHANAFGLADVKLLTTIAEQISAALRNARLHEKMRYLAITDPQTDLYNYRHLQAELARMVYESQASGNSFALAMIDVDNFKRCNDIYGHPTGDHILVQVATLLKETVRQSDRCFRYGGEEFAVAFPFTSHEAASSVAERIRARVSAHTFRTKGGAPIDFTITVSIGIACFPTDATNDIDLLGIADQVLYTAKKAGKDRVLCGLHALRPESA